jgi:nucleotide-binding universal stress UspA family protein
LQAAGAQATGRIVSGRLHEAILGVVREVQADLIVLGRRGMGGVERLLLGSTAERVAGHADCPVLIVHA